MWLRLISAAVIVCGCTPASAQVRDVTFHNVNKACVLNGFHDRIRALGFTLRLATEKYVFFYKPATGVVPFIAWVFGDIVERRVLVALDDSLTGILSARLDDAYLSGPSTYQVVHPMSVDSSVGDVFLASETLLQTKCGQ